MTPDPVETITKAAADTFTLGGILLLTAGTTGYVAGIAGIGQAVPEQLVVVVVGVTLYSFGRLVPR
jgi:hypothetical protein